MSRSFRKAYWTQGYGGKWRGFAKRKAAKKVRQSSEVFSHAHYKRISNSWDICDWKFEEPITSERYWKVNRK